MKNNQIVIRLDKKIERMEREVKQLREDLFKEKGPDDYFSFKRIQTELRAAEKELENLYAIRDKKNKKDV